MFLSLIDLEEAGRNMSSQKIPTLMGRLFYPTMTMLLLSFAFTLLPEWSIVRGADIQDGCKKKTPNF